MFLCTKCHGSCGCAAGFMLSHGACEQCKNFGGCADCKAYKKEKPREETNRYVRLADQLDAINILKDAANALRDRDEDYQTMLEAYVAACKQVEKLREEVAAIKNSLDVANESIVTLMDQRAKMTKALDEELKKPEDRQGYRKECGQCGQTHRVGDRCYPGAVRAQLKKKLTEANLLLKDALSWVDSSVVCNSIEKHLEGSQDVLKD